MCKSFDEIYKVAEALICAKKYREAYYIYGILLKLRPEDASLWHGMANCLERMGDLKNSKIAYENALKFHLMEKENRSKLWAGWAAFKIGKVDLAYELFKETINEDPNYAYSWISFAAAASRKGNNQEAEEARRMYRSMVTERPYKKRECEGKEMLEKVLKDCEGIWKDFIEIMLKEIRCNES